MGHMNKGYVLIIFLLSNLSAMQSKLGDMVTEDDKKTMEQLSTLPFNLIENEIVAVCYMKQWIYAKATLVPTKNETGLINPVDERLCYYNVAINFKEKVRKLMHQDREKPVDDDQKQPRALIS